MTTPAERAAGRRPWEAALAVVLVALAAAGCLGSIGPSPGTGSVGPAVLSSDEPSPEATPVESRGAPATATAGPTEVPSESSGPPDAALVGPADGPVAGDLGTFSWDGLVSDSPWIVPSRAAVLSTGRHLRVRFDGGPPVGAWIARWARIRDGVAGDPSTAGSGDGKPLAIGAPPGPGDWSLQVEARFGGGERAVWYWRVKVER